MIINPAPPPHRDDIEGMPVAAPVDGKTYGVKDAQWEEIVGNSSGESPYVLKAGDHMTGGLNWGESAYQGSSADDISQALGFYDSTANGNDLGISVTSGSLNFVAVHNENQVTARVGLAQIAAFNKNGLNISKGHVILNADPTADLHAASKRYVDEMIAEAFPDTAYLPLTGGKVTGEVEIEGDLHIHGDHNVDTPKLIIKDQDSDERYLLRTEYVPSTGGSAAIGDVKSGFQAADHAGWVKLDGRSVDGLTETQQVAAESLGFTAALPNATGCVLIQSGTLGTVSGSMSKTITQGNLPAVTLTSAASSGTTGAAGGHNHVFQSNINDQGVQNFNEMLAGFGGNDPGSTYPAIKWRGSAEIANTANNGTVIQGYACDGAMDHIHSFGDHTHTVSLGGSGTPLDVTPKALSVNQFVYLGA